MLERLVVFGATGDLASRMLAPALVELRGAGELERLTVVGSGREDWSDDDLADHLAAGLDEHDGILDDDARSWLLGRVSYVQGDVTDPDDVAAAVAGEEPLAVYLALPPALFEDALTAIADHGLPPGSVVAVEKPFGQDLAAARRLNALVAQRFDDVTVFRNDHFLHSQTVHNVLGLRFANRLLEPVWGRGDVAAVDVRWDETLTLAGRAGYYDATGALVDMLQNHLLQVLCFTTMDAPASLAGPDLHLARRSLLRTVATPDRERVVDHSIRARYTAGTVDGRAVPAYVEEDGVDPANRTETFAQVTLELDSWRWAGVPVTLRSGKALAADVAEVVLTFDDVPHRTFATQDGCEPNQLRISLRPPALEVGVNVNAGGELFGLTRVALDAELPTPRVSAYAGLLRDVLAGDTALAVSASEAEEGWRIVEPVLEAWRRDVVPLREYEAGAPLPDDWDTR